VLPMHAREHHDGVSAKWEALLRCRRHRAAVQQMRGELQVRMTPSLCNFLGNLQSSCILKKSLQFQTVSTTCLQHVHIQGKDKEKITCSNLGGKMCRPRTIHVKPALGLNHLMLLPCVCLKCACHALTLCSAAINHKACTSYRSTVTRMSCQ